MSLDGAALLALVSKRNNVTNPPAEKKESNTTIGEPFASDFNKARRPDGHQRQYVSFSIDGGIDYLRSLFVPRLRWKDFCCTGTVCHKTLHVS